MKVDVVELGAITPEFRACIDKDYVLVQESAEAAQGGNGLPQQQAQA